jgi:hypothetical protein
MEDRKCLPCNEILTTRCNKLLSFRTREVVQYILPEGKHQIILLLHVYLSFKRCPLCLFDGAQRHFQQYFSYIVAVSFIGGGNQSTRRKPPTCRKSMTNLSHNVYTPRPINLN